MNKGVYLLFFFLLMLGAGGNAQTKDTTAKTNGYISACGGMAAPLGTFASATGIIPGGNASIGTGEFISGGVIINKLKFGFAIKEGWYQCPFNAGNYINAAQLADTLPNRTFTRAGGDNKYYGGYGMIGLITDLKIHNLIVEFELLAGRLTDVFPEVTYNAASSSGNVTNIDISAVETFGFAFEGGVNARLPLYKHLYLMADFEYMHASLNYASIEQYTNTNGANVTYNLYYTCPLSFLSAVVGIAYKF